MRSPAPTPTCVHSWRPVGSATYSPLPATGGCPPPPGRSAPTSWPPPCHGGPGSACRPERGAKGQRYYDWACLEPPTPSPASTDAAGAGCWWLLIRRSRRTGELAFYRCYAPTPVRLIQLVAVAGRRWTVEESFQRGKGLARLDEHQVRRWLPWRRWTLLAMLAHALLTVLTAGEHAAGPPPTGLIPLTCNELQRLLTRLVFEPARRPTDPEAWSRWRRRHQHRARASHYRRQAANHS